MAAPSNVNLESEFVVIGGGLVGAATAYGLARAGARVTVLDEGDIAFRASRGNFALVWAQTKGLGMPEYALWTRRSCAEWPALAGALREEAGIDVALHQPGGFAPCLSEYELQVRVDQMKRLHNQAELAGETFEVLDHAQTRRHLPELGRDVVGSIYSTRDGHVNSLRLFRALHGAMARRGVRYRPGSPVDLIRPEGGGFTVAGAWGELRAEKLVLAAGLGNARLAPMVGLDVPVRPSKGQIIVTEKAAPFLHYPLATLRQTDEGSVMIGDSQEELGFDTVVTQPVISLMAERAVRMFPLIGRLNIVRTWSALRVMSPDGFPIYDQSSRHRGAFVVTCHSGVTLAAAHAMVLAPMIRAGELPDMLAAFQPKRFHVPATAHA